MKNLKEIIKAILFVAGAGVEIEYFVEKLYVKEKEVRQAIEELKDEFNEKNGIQLIQYKNKIQLTSNPFYADSISAVLNPIREKNLTKATLETLAIIAYKQPITRMEIEDIRGVGSDYTLNILNEHNLITVVGRKDAVGKPLLFGTTDEFLKRFSLNDIDNLPNYDELLERIAVIKQEQTKPQVEQELYFDFKLGENRDKNAKIDNENNENLADNA